MNKYILVGGLVLLVFCAVAYSQKETNPCDGLAAGDACTLGSGVAGVCTEQHHCEGETDCPVFCRAEGNGGGAKKTTKKKAAKKSKAVKGAYGCKDKSEGDACGKDGEKTCQKVDPTCTADCELDCLPTA